MNQSEIQGFQLFQEALINGKFSDDVISHWVQEKREAVFKPLPGDLNFFLKELLNDQWPSGLFSHQVDSWDQIKAGRNLVVSTGTSSGKSLCFYLPILDEIIRNNNSTSLMLFPTKALSSDQFLKISQILDHINLQNKTEKSIFVGVYDGDTNSANRIAIRNTINILISNPDMLHLGILPHHTSWENFLHNLKYIVIDEVHLYRGVFGSHFANVIRRLKRILSFYGAFPQFILTSATISNPKEFAEKLIEEKFEVINTDASPKEERHYYFFNPPVLDPELGLRKGLIDQSVEIADMLVHNQIQSIFFSRTRKTVELALKRFTASFDSANGDVHGYRAGYLPGERRKIESGLRQGVIKAVISTNALEMGIDMGKVDAVIMMGYPGSISSFYQQSGRAGRRNQASAAVLIASASPLDQYIIRHSEYVRGGNPESALIDPDNPLILLNHLRSAAFELPIRNGEPFGRLNWDKVEPYIEVLNFVSELHQKNGNYYWIAEEYPASDISLRNINKNSIILRLIQDKKSTIIGEVDFQSAFRIVHPGAIYLHDGNAYLVIKLDIENSYAELVPFHEDQITEPRIHSSIKVDSIDQSKQFDSFNSRFGELRVVEKVTGYKRIDWVTQQLLGIEELDLPEQELLTKGVWMCFSPDLVNSLRENNLWQSDPNQYGKNWANIRLKVISRDENQCQICRLSYQAPVLHVHHKIPFRSFSDPELANEMNNLITLCPTCHKRVEQNVRIRSGLSGVAFLLSNIAPLYLMCDYRDIGYFSEPESDLCEKQPVIAIYDQFPGGVGLSAALFEKLDVILRHCLRALMDCPCSQGCPSCVGPAGENGIGGKESAKLILECLVA